MAEQTQDTDEDATQTPSQDNENLIEEKQLQDERYEVTDKDITETCDTAKKFKLFEGSQVSVEKKLLKVEATIIAGCNEETPPQNNISGNSSISVVNILKNRISFLENELSKEDTIIHYLSNELITSKRSKSQESTNSSRSVNIYESITVDNYANDTIKETTIKNEKSAKKPRVIITCDSC